MDLPDARAVLTLVAALIIAGLVGWVVQRHRRRVAERRQVGAALRASETQLRRESELVQTIIDRTPVMLTVYDPNTKILRLNPEFEHRVGWTTGESTGISLMERCYPDPDYREQVARFMTSCEPGWRDFRMRTRDGREIEASWANVRLSDLTQVGIGIDITERKHAEQSLARRAKEQAALFNFTAALHRAGSLEEVYTAALDSILAALGCDRGSILLFDDTGVMRFVAWRGLSERYRNAVEGHSPWRAEETNASPVTFHDIEASDIPASLKSTIRDEGIRAVGFIPLISDGRLIGKFMTYFDTPHAFDERELELALTIAGQLSFAIQRIRTDVRRQEAERALRDADRRKDEFLAMLAHELRNPLAPIRNVAHILASEHVDASTVRRNSELLERQVSQLARLVDDLLDVARISRGTIELRKETVAIESILDRALEDVQSMVARRQQIVRVTRSSVPLQVEGDATRLCQVLVNLLNNASKYSSSGATIRVALEQAGEDAVIRILDDGVGIDAQALPHIFELFVQADRSLDRREGGLGVGLTIVRHLVELHGGSVEARSAGLGLGSEFIVRLPRLARPVENPEPSAAHPPAAQGRSILVVEDNLDSAESLATLLRLAGHEVRTALDGPAALEQLEKFRAEFILLDIGLPGMDGYHVARSIRARFPDSPVRIFALSGYGRAEDRRRALASGFDDCFTKPIDPAKLLELFGSSSPT